MSLSESDAHRDAQVIKALFASLCTTIPEDLRLELLRTSNLELKFLIAVQPRVSSFSHRRRHSLRHPALSMAVQRFYWLQRLRRLGEEVEAMERDANDPTGLAQRRQQSEAEAERINAMLADYASRGDGHGSTSSSAGIGRRASLSGVPLDDGASGAWSEFGASISGSLWHYRRMSSAAGMGAGMEGVGPAPLQRSRSLSIASAQLQQPAPPASALRRPSGLSESVMSVIRNSSQYIHLLEFPDAGSTPADTVDRIGSSSSAAGSGTNFFFNKHRQLQQQAAMNVSGKKNKGKPGSIMPALGMGIDMYTTTGADDMEEEEEFVAYQQSEDLRWEQLATCYDQMLRAANAPCRLAALTAAVNGMLNDIIRRFWDRVTVAPAAKERYQRNLAGGSAGDDVDDRAATTPKGPGNRRSGGVARRHNDKANDSDDDNEGEGKRTLLGGDGKPSGAATSGSDKDDLSAGADVQGVVADPSSRTSDADGDLARRGKGSATGAKASAVKKKSGTGASKAKRSVRIDTDRNTVNSPGPRNADDNHGGGGDGSGEGLADTATGGGRGGGGSTRRKTAGSAGETGGSGTRAPGKRRKAKKDARAADKGGGTALYMSPLQYVYLNMRIASVLLPPGNDLEMEMLESVREDLLMDGAYAEDDLQLEHYFGKAPVLVVPPGVVPPKNPNPPEDQLMRPTGGLRHALRGTGYGAAAGKYGRSGGHRWSDAMATDYGESVGPNSMAAGAGSVFVRGGGGDHHGFDPWDTSHMPWLSYAQFWNTMMELADNWTCSAANPVECAVFLMELYGDVFGHDWDEEDQSYFNMLKRKHTQQQGTDGERAQESLEVLASFQEMLEDLEEMSGSDSDVFLERHFGRRHSHDMLHSPTRRRSTKRFSHGESGGLSERGGGGDGGDSDDSDSIDWTGRRKKDGWRYRRYLEEQTGKWKRHRRKTVLERSKSSKRVTPVPPTTEAVAPSDHDDDKDSNEAGLDSASSQYSVYILEEELDSDNEVIRRRRLHRHKKETADGEDGTSRKKRRKHPRKRRANDSDDEFMYEQDNGEHGGGLVRRYYDKPAHRFRRLDNGARKDDYADGVDENLSANTSWSSFADAEEARETEGWLPFRPLQSELERQPRVRKRVRRTGTRAERRRYGRDPAYFYRSGFDDDDDDFSSEYDSDLSSLTGSAIFSDFSYSVDEDEDLRAPQDTAEALTEDQREYLRSRRSWLQRMLATKGVHISDAAFTDPGEEAMLYQLLLMTEQLAAKAEAAGGSFEEADDIGIADFDAALLAKLFAKPKSYTLEELQQSELMKMLLAMGEDSGEGKIPLSAAQMDGILAALMSGRRPGGPPETASVRRRREKMIAEARQLQKALWKEEHRRRAEEKAERRRRREEERAAAAAAAEGTFGLTEVVGTDGDGSRPASQRRRPPLGADGQRTPLGDNIQDDQLFLRQGFTTTPSLSLPRPVSSASLQRPLTSGGGGDEEAGPVPDGALPPLTQQERREQERLFREFEAYCAEHAEQTSRYRMTFTEYTPEQLEAFFQHLCLGPKQQALLRGRAPLAPATSTVGGTLHQRRGQRHEHFLLGGGTLTTFTDETTGEDKTGGAASAAPPQFVPAPVKVFTLTTASTLEDALQENLQSYLEDRGYLGSMMGGSAQAPPQHQERNTWLRRRQDRQAALVAAAKRGQARGDALPPLPKASMAPAGTAATGRNGAATERNDEWKPSRARLPSVARATAAAAAAAPPTTTQDANSFSADVGFAAGEANMGELVATPEVMLARAAAAIEDFLKADAASTSNEQRTTSPSAAAAGKKKKTATSPAATHLSSRSSKHSKSRSALAPLVEDTPLGGALGTAGASRVRTVLSSGSSTPSRSQRGVRTPASGPQQSVPLAPSPPAGPKPKSRAPPTRPQTLRVPPDDDAVADSDAKDRSLSSISSRGLDEFDFEV